MIDFSNKDDLNKIISENTITIIQYGATTCMPCHSIKNKITTWQQDHKRRSCILYLIRRKYGNRCSTRYSFGTNRRSIY